MPDSSEYYIMNDKRTPAMNELLELNKKNKINEHWYGIVFNDKSSLSRKLSSSKQLKKQVADYYINKKEFTSKNKISVGFDKDKDLEYSIGHCTIINPRIDEKGNFTGILFDKYDFDFWYKEYKSNKFITGANNIAAVGQIGPKPLVKNYYILVPVKFKLK